MMASPTEPAAIPMVTLDKAAETNFAGNVHAQVPKTNLRPLERDQDILDPFNYRTNKAKVTVEFRYLKPPDKAERGMIESITM